MKKFLHVLILLLFISTNLLAQTVLFSDDFESYNTTQKLAEQSSAPEWTTWSGNTGGGEDAAISTVQAYGGVNSAKVITNNDLVLDLGGKTTGRYQVKFRLYIKSNKGAFFGFMQDFNGNNTEFGLSANFKLDTGIVDIGANKFKFDYKFDTWMFVSVVIDLDNDFASFSIDDNVVAAGKWSVGADGGSTTNELDGIDFWGYDDENGCEYYLDEVVYGSIDSYDNPTNLVSSLTDDDVSLSWDAPASGSPTGYAIFRNNKFIATTVNTTYDDIDIYPGTYEYSVRAIFGELGLSPASNVENEAIAGGFERKLVLYEIVTGTWCQYCPGAAMGVHDLLDNNLNVGVVKYHGGDDYQFADGYARIRTYYESYVGGYPTSIADGLLYSSGGSGTQSLYPQYKAYYDQRKDILSTHDIDLEISKISGNNYKAEITVTEGSEYFPDNLVLITALTESNIAEYWQGQTKVNFACRALYPDSTGTSLDFSTSNTQKVTLNFTVDDSWVPENCELVAFVQYNTTKEVVQAVKSEIIAPSVSISVANESTDVKLDQDIVFTFSDPIRHLTDDTIEVVDSMIVFKKNDQNGDDIAFEAIINEGLNQITVSHDSLDENTTYYLQLSNYIENFYDMQVDEDLSISFTTESIATGIDNFEAFENFKVYPNPFTDRLNLVFNSKEMGNAIIEIYNQSGVLVKYRKQQNSAGEQFIEINTEDMASGIYFLNLRINNQKVFKKIVLLR